MTDAESCSSSPCENGATCENLLADFRCHCAPGWTGSTCELGDIVQTVYNSNKINHFKILYNTKSCSYDTFAIIHTET